MTIATTNFLRSEELGTYPSRDTTYSNTAAPITTTRFGPSGSLKSENSTLESTIAVTPKMRSDIFFDLEYIVVSIVEIHQLAMWNDLATFTYYASPKV
jgi:hypothetical protein